MAIVLPAFTTSAVITSATLISQTDEQLNILMNDMKTYAEGTFSAIQNSLIAEAGNVLIQDTIPILATGKQALWIDTSNGNFSFNLVQGD